ncbi:MAG: HAD family hydrolase [Candidatus Paceibacterota bacterium]
MFEGQIFEGENREERKNDVYTNAVFRDKNRERKEKGLSTVLLATDIDRTFISNFREVAAELDEAEAWAESARLANELAGKNIPLMYVTGNGIDNVIPRIESGELALPSIIASAVGTELWVLQNDEQLPEDAKVIALPSGETAFFEYDTAFHEKLEASGYDRREIAQKGVEFVDAFWSGDCQKTAEELNGMTFQDVHQEEALLADPNVLPTQLYKTSFYFFARSSEEVKGIQATAEELFGYRAIVCEELGYNTKLLAGESRKKYCLDILPITKADPVNYLAQEFDIDYTIVAGDSGNDAVMLEEAGDLAIIVGGAREELKDYIDELLEDEGDRVSGKGSFKKVSEENGESKLYYTGKQLGPESIMHALKILDRGQNMYKSPSGD